MATSSEKRDALDEWGAHFPNHHKWKNQFLIRRNGAVLSGICLDATRDSRMYKPLFFFHNLLVQSPAVTLSYAAPLLSRGVYKPLRYGHSAEADIQVFKEQIPLSQDDVSFQGFLSHIADAMRGKFGVQAIYLPHALRDAISVGSYLGDGAYYLSTLHYASELIRSRPGLNIGIIGSVGQWESKVGELIRQDGETVIQSELETHKLPNIENLGMHYGRINNYWEWFAS